MSLSYANRRLLAPHPGGTPETAFSLAFQGRHQMTATSDVASPPPAWLDAVGITVSLACAVHCAATPVMFSFLTMLGVASGMPPWVEWAFLTLALLIGGLALRTGVRRHGQRTPAVAFALGILLLASARIVGEEARLLELLLVLSGAGSIVAAHALNWRQRHRCEAQ